MNSLNLPERWWEHPELLEAEAKAAREEAERCAARVRECDAWIAAMDREREEEKERRQREHEEICRQRGLDGSVRSALVCAYILGRSGFPICEDVLNKLMSGLEAFDVVRIERDMVAMKRELASLRREVEASRPHKVVAMRVREP